MNPHEKQAMFDAATKAAGHTPWQSLLTDQQKADLPEDLRQVEAIKKGEPAPHRSRVINRDYVRRWSLEIAKDSRCHKFTRVSEEFLNAIERATKAEIRSRIMRHPSKGKTLT